MFKANPMSFVNQFHESVKNKQYVNFTAEVVDIVLDKSHPAYKTNHSIGMIQFKSYYGGMNGYATPLNIYDNITPLIHESVLIIQGTAFNAGTTDESLKYYYTDPINVWNIINCNLVPFSTRDINKLKISKSEEYSSFTGVTPDIKNSVTFGKYFKEKLYIPKLIPFEGDIIHQGRWGQSIRFGSINSKDLNTWSSKGVLGTPLIILRVNQIETVNVNDVTIENINTDASSIYICESTLISLDLASISNNSYKYKSSSAKLLDPKNFIGRQLLFNSDRIILNAKQDGIKLSAKKTIHINSNQSINLDSEVATIIEAPEIILGQKANTPAVLGNEIKDILNDMNVALSSLCDTLSTINTLGTPTAQSLNPALVTKFQNSGIQFKKIQNKLDTILSKKITIE